MSTRIIFDGKEYANVEEMPFEVRRAYEQIAGLLADHDGDGNSDLAGNASASHTLTVRRMRFVHDGKVYSSVEEMPPEVRRQYHEAVRQLGHADRDGNSDVLERVGTTGNIEETRHVVVRTTQGVRLDGLDARGTVKSLLFSVGTSFLLAVGAAVVALAVLILSKLL